MSNAQLVQDSETAEAAPTVAVVIPVYKQPLFLVEAVASVLAQDAPFPIVTIIVDDGCPMPATRETALILARTNPGRVVYLRRPNGGLSAARNSGVDFVLQAFPACEAIYFLDSDNRIMPGFLARALAQLRAANAGWAYPDIDMFGVPGHYSTKGSYSLLLHLFYNYCEAGSLVAREIFERGARFDEAMRLGFEDWDFWLQAASLGFRGVFVPRAGFLYRRRGESMLTHSERARPEILGYIRRKHKNLLKVKNLLALEAEELPRYALALAESTDVHSMLDPLAPPARVEDRKSFVSRFALSEYAPAAHAGPRLLGMTSAATIALLARAGIARHIFWLAEHVLRDGQFFVLRIARSTATKLKVARCGAASAEDFAAAALILIAAPILCEIVRDSGSSWVQSIATEAPVPHAELVTITLPASLSDDAAPDPADHIIARAMLGLLEDLRLACHATPTLPMDWREDKRSVRRDVSIRLFSELGLGTIYPHVAHKTEKHIGFLLPIFEFGGVEKVVANYARVLTGAGYICHLFMTEHDHIEWSDDFAAAFASVSFLSPEDQYPFDWSFGGPVLGGLTPATREALGQLATMDVIFNTHSVKMHGLISELRRLGALTFVGLHLNEITSMGLPIGNANFALAYEHVYDGFVVISEDMRSWCLGQAISAEKIHLVKNAPSYAVPPRDLAAARRTRARRAEKKSPLRVLYLGRLDAQKGLDRLDQIHDETKTLGILWRVVGKTVHFDGVVEQAPSRLPIEPPALEPAAVNALYLWADVVVLPSRFEGVPLILLEAERMGAVVIATDVGAVGEIVADGTTGFLVTETSEAAIVARFVAILRHLADDRAALLRIAEAAMAARAAEAWETNLAAFTIVLDHLLAAKAA